VRLIGDRRSSVLPGQRRYERSRPLVAGLGLRLVRQLVPVLVVRWVPWSEVRLVLPLGLVLEKDSLISQTREFISYFIKACCRKFGVFQWLHSMHSQELL